MQVKSSVSPSQDRLSSHLSSVLTISSIATLCSAEKNTTVQCQNVLDQVPVDELVLNLGTSLLRHNQHVGLQRTHHPGYSGDLDEIIGGESSMYIWYLQLAFVSHVFCRYTSSSCNVPPCERGGRTTFRFAICRIFRLAKCKAKASAM